MKKTSIITRINLSMAAIILMAISTIMVSYWLSDQADKDAYVVNIAGSMRMLTYRMQLDPQQPSTAQAQIEEILHNPVLNNVIYRARLTEPFQTLQQHWQQLLTSTPQPQQFDDFVAELNALVLAIQHNAENNIHTLRMFQVVTFFITIILSGAVIYWIHLRFTLPLNELTESAQRISQGDFSYSATPSNNDEFYLLAQTFEQMSNAIANMYGSLENQVEEKTTELRNSNKRLKLLYNIARRISAHEVTQDDFQDIIGELTSITGIEPIKLCILHPACEPVSKPYLCTAHSSEECIAGRAKEQNFKHFPISRENRDYGVLSIEQPNLTLSTEEQDLFTSVSSLFAIAMGLQNEEANIRRMTLINERTVIARELHDSLAQALSYLKIQVTRLNRAISKSDFETMHDISGELKEGLDSAYRQLRELLTTFRLKVDDKGLSNALEKTIAQYNEQSSINFYLDYQITNALLNPQEEIHLLQIIRESCQNTIHHSQGTETRVRLTNSPQGIQLSVEDNGVGIGSNREKLNHYGMAIIQERSRQLHGQLEIRRRPEGGTGVYFTFLPESQSQPISS